MKLPVGLGLARDPASLPDPVSCPARPANKLADPESAFRMDDANCSADTLVDGKFLAWESDNSTVQANFPASQLISETRAGIAILGDVQN